MNDHHTVVAPVTARRVFGDSKENVMSVGSVREIVEGCLGLHAVEARKVATGVLLRFGTGCPTLIAEDGGDGHLHLWSFPHNVPCERLSGVVSPYLLGLRQEIAVL